MNQPFVFEDELELRWKLSRRMPTGFLGLDFVVATAIEGFAEHWSGWRLELHFLCDPREPAPSQIVQVETRHLELSTLAGLPLEPQRLQLASEQPDPARPAMRSFRMGLLRDAKNMPTLLKINLVGLDWILPMLGSAEFSLVGPEAHMDSRMLQKSTNRVLPPLEIDYRGRDYESLRDLMLNQLSTSAPQWQADTPADLGMVMVETLAYAADRISYLQDAVGTESYLGTARQRISLRRHARLLDYKMGEGCNARTWVHFEVDAHVSLPEKQVLMTKLEHYDVTIVPIPTDRQGRRGSHVALERALAGKAQIFETLHPAELHPTHNRLDIFTFESNFHDVQSGATSLCIKGHDPYITVGLPLLIEQITHPDGRLANPDHRMRHVVRVTAVRRLPPPNQVSSELARKIGSKLPIFTEISWGHEDALPFTLNVTHGSTVPLAVVRGNLVLADHGNTQTDLELPVVTEQQVYNPVLDDNQLTWWVPYEHEAHRHLPAVDSLEVESRNAVPYIYLTEINPFGVPIGTHWEARHDLLFSSPFDRHFVVEVDNARKVHLRFGDGVNGWRPAAGNRFLACLRSGTGLAGNIGSDTIRHLVHAEGISTFDKHDIIRVRNPLPAVGGLAHEALSRVRLAAPSAWYTQARCVTEEDYAAMAQRHPEVNRAVARRVWTGSWYTMFVYVDRAQGKPVDQKFKEWVLRFLEPYLLLSDQVTILTPHLVALEIALRVEVLPGHFPNQVRGRLMEVLGPGVDRHGQLGLFHPDRLSFGQTIDLNTIVSRALQVEGVKYVSREVFRRYGEDGRDTLRLGKIEVGPLDIPCVRNDPEAPSQGSLTITLNTADKRQRPAPGEGDV